METETKKDFPPQDNGERMPATADLLRPSRPRRFPSRARPLMGAALLTTLLMLAYGLWLRHRAAAPPPDSATLARLRAATPAGMTLVPGGECLLGSDDPDADDEVKPMHRAFIPSFYIDTHEVTNADYQRFDSKHTFFPGDGDLPVTKVTYAQAAGYAKWAGKRLPTDEEWEKAARGTDGRRYPWGNTWDPRLVAPRAQRQSVPVTSGSSHQPEPVTPHIDSQRVGSQRPGSQEADASALKPRTSGKSNWVSCNLGAPRVQRVGSVAGGVSPYGCYDMAGNAWEWVQGFYNGNPDQRILRGGAVGYGERACRTYTRGVEGSGST